MEDELLDLIAMQAEIIMQLREQLTVMERYNRNDMTWQEREEVRKRIHERPL